MTKKIATWNVNSIKVRLEQVLEWLNANQPDVLALQETKSVDENFPTEAFRDAGYQVVFSGQKTYNGVAIISKTEATDTVTDIPGLDDPQRRILAATIDGVRVIDLYVPNGQSVDSDKYHYKLDWLAKVQDYVTQQLTEHAQLVVLGDFNIAPADLDVHDPEEWQGHVLVSEPERKAFQSLIASGLQDSFRHHRPEEQAFSWWDYRAAGFRRNRGLRIDHILISQSLAEICQDCYIDKQPRTWERPSDHTVVVAEFG